MICFEEFFQKRSFLDEESVRFLISFWIIRGRPQAEEFKAGKFDGFPKKGNEQFSTLNTTFLHTFRNIPPDNEANSIENFKSEIEIQLTEKGLIWPQISYRNAQTWKKNAWSIL